MGWMDEIPEGDFYYMEVGAEGGADSSTVIKVRNEWTKYADFCEMEIYTSDWLSATATVDGEPVEVKKTSYDDGTAKFDLTSKNEGELEVEFIAPPDYPDDNVGLKFYPPKYKDGILYETLSDNAFDEPWSNVQDVPGWSDKWEDYSEKDLMDISKITDDALDISFEYDGSPGSDAVHLRYLDVPPELKIQDIWIGYAYHVFDWFEDSEYYAKAYLALYAEKGDGYSGLMLDLNRLTSWFYGVDELTQDTINDDDEITDCYIEDSGLIAVKPWSMYEQSGLEKDPLVITDKSESASLLDGSEIIKHAMLFVELHTDKELPPAIYVTSNYEYMYIVDSDSMERTHKEGLETYGFDFGTGDYDGVIFAGSNTYDGEEKSVLKKIDAEDLTELSGTYIDETDGDTLLQVVYDPDSGYLYVGGGDRNRGKGSGTAAIAKVDPSDLSIVGTYTDFENDDVCVYSLVLGKDGYLYAGASDSNKPVHKINKSDMSQAAVLEAGGDAEGDCDGGWCWAIVYDPNGSYIYAAPLDIYINNDGDYDDCIVKLRTSDLSVVDWYPLNNDYVECMAWGQDGYLYAGCRSQEIDGLLKIDPGTMTLKDSKDFGYATIAEVHYAPDGYLYIFDDYEPDVKKIDPSDLSVIDTFEDGYDLGGYAYIHHRQNRYKYLESM